MTSSAAYDVFLSHNRKQKAWVRHVARLLRNHGLKVFFDEDSLRPGDELLEAIERGVMTSQTLVLVLSRSSLVSRWVALEAGLHIYEGVTSPENRLIPVLVEPVDRSQIRLAVQRLVFVDLTDPATRENELMRLLETLGLPRLGPEELPPWPEPSGVHELYIADLDDVTRWQWSQTKLIEELIALDYRLFDDLSPELEGRVEQWLPVYLDHPDTWRLLVTPQRELVGYWHFVPLFDDDFASAMAGRLRDAELTANRVCLFELPGTYPLYFVCIALLPQFRRTKGYTLLIDSFFDVIREFAQGGIFFDRLCANAYTPSGEALCKTFGLVPVAPHVDRGWIHAGRMDRLLQLPYCSRYRDVQALYGSRADATGHKE